MANKIFFVKNLVILSVLTILLSYVQCAKLTIKESSNELTFSATVDQAISTSQMFQNVVVQSKSSYTHLREGAATVITDGWTCTMSYLNEAYSREETWFNIAKVSNSGSACSNCVSQYTVPLGTNHIMNVEYCHADSSLCLNAAMNTGGNTAAQVVNIPSTGNFITAGNRGTALRCLYLTT